MPKAKPVSIRRKSFGGQTGIGIWWRKSSSSASILLEEDGETNGEVRSRDLSSEASASSIDPSIEGTSTSIEVPLTKRKKLASTAKKAPASCLFTTDEEPILGWDDDLCRPIYHRSENHHDAIATIDSFDDELVRAVSCSDSGIAECTETDVSTEVIHEDLSECSQDTSDSFITSPSAKKRSSSSKTPESTGSGQDEEGAGASFRNPGIKRTRTFGDRGRRRRPLSLVLMQEEEEEAPLTLDSESRRISLGSSSDAVPTEEEVVADSKAEEGPKQPKKGRRSKKPRSKDPSNSLEKAREYFANLDQTQPLTLDATMSPPVSSRVTRTRRKTNLASPGINREYKAYAESIAGDGSTGVLPLSIKDYASSRKLHFQSKGKLVDGFLDD